MNWKAFAALYILLTTFVQTVSAADIRVRVKSSPNSVTVYGRNIAIANTAKTVQSVTSELKNFPILCRGSESCQVEIQRKNKETYVKSKEQTFGPFREVKLTGRELRVGSIELPSPLKIVSTQKRLDVITYVSLEKYVQSVVAAEVPSSWPIETLKAQAIAVRSYALATQQERKKQSFDVESSVLDQVFSWNHNFEKSEKNKNLILAVKETQGQVLMMNRKVLKSFFHSDCGGATVKARNVWLSGIDAGVTKDSFCVLSSRSRQSRWVYKLPEKELKNKLAKYLGVHQEIQVMIPVESKDFDETGRLKALRVVGLSDASMKFEIPGNQLRAIIGFGVLKSTKFQMNLIAGSYVFTGVGFGHGVGMCQHGSRVMGSRGYSFGKILSHYYPNAKLESIASFSTIN